MTTDKSTFSLRFSLSLWSSSSSGAAAAANFTYPWNFHIILAILLFSWLPLLLLYIRPTACLVWVNIDKQKSLNPHSCHQTDLSRPSVSSTGKRMWRSKRSSETDRQQACTGSSRGFIVILRSHLIISLRWIFYCYCWM